MKKKIVSGFILGFFVWGFFFIPAAHAKNLGEDRQLIQVGIGAFKDGFYDIAEKQFTNFVSIYPKHDKVFDIYYLLGRTLLINGKLKEAKKAFSKIINEGHRFENMDYALLGMAELETRSGNWEEAKKLLISIIEKFPKCDQIDYSYYLLGLLEFASDQLTAAVLTLKKVPQYSKNDELIRSSYFWLGIVSFKQRQYDTASAYFQALWENPRSVPPEYLKYALFWLGESQLRSGRMDEAKNNYQTFSARFKNDHLLPEASWRTGVCEYQSGNFKNSMETFQLFKSQFKDSPLIPYSQYLIGRMLLANGDYLSSIKELNSTLNASQDSSWGGISLLTLYWNYIQLGDLDGANRIFQRLQKLNHFEEEKTFIQWLNAEIFYAGGEISESLAYYFNILNTRFREKALFQIGKGYFFEGKLRESITNLDILLLEFPNSKYLEEGLFIKGECLAKLGNIDQALDTYSLIVQQNKNNPWQLFALTQMGYIYAFRNEYDKAESAFKKVMEGFPNHPLFYRAALQLGNLTFAKNNIVEAVRYYSIVLKGNIVELFGEAYFGLGEIFFQQGKYEKALKTFETAMQYLKETSSWFFLAHLEIGNLKRIGGKYEEAKKSYLIILDQSKDEEMRKAANDLLNRMESR
ncbi:MAG TPA: tetratricopeptide repeat protein [Thermodesulfobacteriota bacterium]|nr:tetratricopeptide repeat protein [Thermodesulfobacteriota bacterium]